MRNCDIFGTVAVALLLATGCQSRTLREGVWRLSIHAKDINSQKPVDIPDSRVRLLVGTKEEGGEQVEIRRLAYETAAGYKPSLPLTMYGDISEDGSTLKISYTSGVDDYWVFQLFGTILNETTVNGQALFARHRIRDDIGLAGLWSLTWLED